MIPSLSGLIDTVNEFVAIFAGLTATAKRKAVTDAAGLSRAPLSRLLNGSEFNHEAVERLLGAMIHEAKRHTCSGSSASAGSRQTTVRARCGLRRVYASAICKLLLGLGQL
jgi:hypothetical protein